MNKHHYQKPNHAYLIQMLQKFNPSVLEDSHSSYSALIHHFANLLNDAEKALIESILSAAYSIITLSNTNYDKLIHLKVTHYLIAIGKNRYYLSPEFINDYNQYYLNAKYPPLPILEDWVQKDIITLSLIEEKRRVYDTMDFKTALSNRYNTQNLNFICVMANIKNYNQLTDSEKCTLIMEKVTRDYGLFEKLIQIVPPLRILFAYMVYEDRNSFVGAKLPGENIAIFILFSDIETNTIYLPKDLFEHLKAYFNLYDLDPEEILKQSIENFTSQELDYKLQTMLIKDLCHNQLSVDEVKRLLPALIQSKIPENILSDLNTETKTKFFESLVNLYGFIPIRIVVELYNTYFNAHETINSMSDMINMNYDKAHFVISNHYLTHITLKDAYQTLDALYETIPYYLPPTFKALLKAVTSENEIDHKKFNDSMLFLKNHINLQGDSFDIPIFMVESAVFEDVILPNIKMVPKEDDLKDAVQMWKLQGLYNQIKMKQVLKHVKVVYSKLRLWTYRGHNQQEYNEIIHQYFTHHKPNTDDWNSDKSI